MRSNGRLTRVVATASLLALTTAAHAAIDSIIPVYDLPAVTDPPTEGAVAGQLAGFGYDPVNNRLQIGVTSSVGGLFTVDNVGSASPVATRKVSQAQQQTFTFGRQPVAFGVALNPVTFNGAAPYSVAYIVDAHAASVSTDLSTTRRLYSWNLGAEGAAPGGTSTVLSPALSAAQIIAASSGGTANPAAIRQPRFGNDGKSVYFGVASSNTNGIYRYDASTSTVSRLQTVSVGALGSQEVGVQKLSATSDRILYADSTGNLVYKDYDYSGAGTFDAQKTLVSVDKIRDFIRGTAATGVFAINNVVSDDDTGNVYFQVGTGQATQPRNVFLQVDPQGRLAKVTTVNEVRSVRINQSNTFTGTQIAPGSYTGAGGTFAVKQLYFGNATSSTSYIGKINLFKAGDFNRDNVVNAADATLLRTSGALSPVGTTTSNTDLFKFDMNGDSVASTVAAGLVSNIDYYDVKAFQQFLPFANGDADFNLTLDFSDINVARDNYLGSGKIWTTGDFNGDNTVNLQDLKILADAWVYGLGQPRLSAADIDTAGYTGQFRNDLVTAFNVPEPTTIGLLAAGTLLVGRRRRTS